MYSRGWDMVLLEYLLINPRISRKPTQARLPISKWFFSWGIFPRVLLRSGGWSRCGERISIIFRMTQKNILRRLVVFILCHALLTYLNSAASLPPRPPFVKGMHGEKRRSCIRGVLIHYRAGGKLALSCFYDIFWRYSWPSCTYHGRKNLAYGRGTFHFTHAHSTIWLHAIPSKVKFGKRTQVDHYGFRLAHQVPYTFCHEKAYFNIDEIGNTIPVYCRSYRWASSGPQWMYWPCT